MYKQDNYIHGYNIHSCAHVLDMKWIFLLIKKRYNSDKLCQNFSKPEKLSPPPGHPPLQSSISQWQAYKAKEILGRVALCAPKGQKDADSSINK